MNTPTREAVEATLKPCPFCGAAAELVDDERRDSEGTYPVYYVGCSNCSAGMGEYRDFETPAAVAEEWNRRAGEDLSQTEEITRLRAKLADLRAVLGLEGQEAS